MIKTLWKASGKAFEKKYLIYTNIGLSCSLSCVGDVIEQQYEIAKKQLQIWDKRRMCKMALSGFPIGVVCHYYYQVLDRILPGRSIKIVAKKLIIDQVICSPICITTFLLSVAYLERMTLQDCVMSFKKKFWRMYVADWIVWPPAQIFNFYFLPPKYRVLYDNVISLGYDIYTSNVNHRNFE